MSIKSSITCDFKEKNSLYYELLSEEDFEFKTKDILLDVKRKKDKVEIQIEADSVLDFKIGTSALIKSLEVITKTLEV